MGLAQHRLSFHGDAVVGGAWPMDYILDAPIPEAMVPRYGLHLLENIVCSRLLSMTVYS
jgi:hypothetical protein